MPIGEAIFTAAAGAVASKGVEKTMSQSEHIQAIVAGGIGAVLLGAYLLTKGKKVMDIDKKWVLAGGIAGLAYAGWHYSKITTGTATPKDFGIEPPKEPEPKDSGVEKKQKVEEEPDVF